MEDCLRDQRGRTVEICQLVGVPKNFSLVCRGFGELCIAEVEEIITACRISILLPSPKNQIRTHASTLLSFKLVASRSGSHVKSTGMCFILGLSPLGRFLERAYT